MSQEVNFSKYSDHELLTLLSADNSMAFSEIYSRYWHNLFLHAYKMIGDEDASKDIIQELFIALWAKRQDLHIRLNLKSYLYVTARNQVLNYIRKYRKIDDLVNLIAEEMSELDYHTIDGIDERQLIIQIDEEISRLPPKMRLVFEMSRKEFLTHKEIAQRLGTSEETVKKQISNSLKVLRKRMGSHFSFFLFF